MKLALSALAIVAASPVLAHPQGGAHTHVPDLFLIASGVAVAVALYFHAKN
jgi:hypothetical protein